MFQFPGFAAYTYGFSARSIRESRDQRSFDSSPGLIAVFHALHRLLAPRHPPHALSSLAALILSSHLRRLRHLRTRLTPLHQPLVATHSDRYMLILASMLTTSSLVARTARDSLQSYVRHLRAHENANVRVRQLFRLPNCQRSHSCRTNCSPLSTSVLDYRRFLRRRLACSAHHRTRCTSSSERFVNFSSETAPLQSNGDDRDRTGNLRLAKPALSQLSYVPGRARVRGSEVRGRLCRFDS